MKKIIAVLMAFAFAIVVVLGTKHLINIRFEYPNAETTDVICGEGCDIDNTRKVGYQVGDRFPNIKLTDIDGNESNLYDLMEGKEKFIINFSVDWCDDCTREKEKLNSQYSSLVEKNIGVAVIYIDLSKDENERSTSIEQTKKYLEANDFEFPTYIDYNSRYKHRINITSLPVNFVLDKHAVVKAHTEEIDMDNLLLENTIEFKED